MTKTKPLPVFDWENENLELFPIRVYPSVLKRVRLVLDRDKGEHWESTSHFVRCSMNWFLNTHPEAKKLLIKHDKKYIFQHRKVFKQTK